MRAHAEWNVDTHILRATGPTSSATRSFISPAALLVNVIASSSNGETPRSAIRYATRCVSNRVLPEPAPATTSTGPSGAVTASRWTGFRPSRKLRRTHRAHRTGVRVSVPVSDFGVQLAALRSAGRRRSCGTRAQQARPVLVERHRERAGVVVELEREVRLPVGVERGRVEIRVGRKATEATALRCRRARCCGQTRSVPRGRSTYRVRLRAQGSRVRRSRVRRPYVPGIARSRPSLPTPGGQSRHAATSGSATSGRAASPQDGRRPLRVSP